MDTNSAPAALAAWRAAHGLSQHDLAARLSASQGAVSQWETSAKTPSLMRALEIEALTGIPVTSWGHSADAVTRLRALVCVACDDPEAA